MLVIILMVTFANSLDAEKDINLFLGRWLPTATYPKIQTFSKCMWYDVVLQPDNLNCKCGDEIVPAIEFKPINYDTGFNRNYRSPVVIIENSSEVAEAVKTKCTCDNKPIQHLVIRYVNEKYFIYYVLLPAEYTEKEPNTAVLATRNYTTTKELDAVESQIDDLKDRSRAYLCDPQVYENHLNNKTVL